MIDTQKTLSSAASCGAAMITTLGGEASAAVALAAIARPDVLVVAAAAEWIGNAASTALSGRPPRPARTDGWAGSCAVLAQSCPVKTAAGASTSTTSRSTRQAKTTRTTSSSSSSSTATSASKSASSSSSSKTSGALGFLNDPKLSVEDKLFQFMCYMADKYEKDLDKKLKEIGGKQGSSSSSGSSGSKKSGGGGLLGGLLGGGGGGGGILGGLLGGGGGAGGGGGGGGPGGLLSMTGLGALAGNSGLQDLITQASGPLLAAGACACGFPELAPVMLKAGPELTQGVLGALGGGSGSSGSSSGTSGSSGSGPSSGSSSASGEPEVSQKDMLELQRLQDKQKEMFSMVSNMLRTMHETKMAVINNLHA